MAKSDRILVTGAGGSIGAELCMRLAANGGPVSALVRSANRAEPLLKAGIRVVEADVRDRAALGSALQDIDVVMHLAAIHTHAGASDRDYHEVNVVGARNVVEVAQERSVRRVVHVSSIGVHGDTGPAGVREDSPYAPMDVYTRTKLEGELAVREVFDRGQIEGVVVRPLGIYGPGDHRFIKLFKGVKQRRFPMIGRCDALTQLCYIESFVDIMRLCADTPGITGRVYLAGDVERPSIREFVTLVAHAVGGGPLPFQIPLLPTMIAARIVQAVCKPFRIDPPLYPRRLEFYTVNRAADVSRIGADLGFRTPSTLQQRVSSTAAWYEAQGMI